MSLAECFEHEQIGAVSGVFGGRVSEAGGSYGEGSVTPALVLDPEWWRWLASEMRRLWEGV